MATFTFDTFTDADATGITSHTGETGATWTRHSSSTNSSMQVKTNRLAASGVLELCYSSGTPATAEYDVSADLFVVSTAVDEEWQICGRVNTGALTYYFFEYYHGTASWRLFKRVAGAFTSLGTFSQSLTVSTTYNAKLQIRDAQKAGIIDGVTQITSGDNAITAAGQAGLAFDTAASLTGGYHMDNFTAADPSASDTLFGQACF